MLTMTEQAGEYLTKLLDEAQAPEDKCIRLAAKGDHLVLQFASEEDSDATYMHGGRTVLVVEEGIAEKLDGQKVDIEKKDGKHHLVLS